ncbi:hypothetical protein VKI21_06880 [Cyanobacterium aponinum UTEX 3222]|uniref:hypothetical protein n=1 Tax=Cyanobacterium aponinum TaxID=379064 RepID=UPI00308521A4|nr:hypothetical protein VKI21_06880 [Cyanobacterium aponinum UTEX 3222]
MIEQKPLPISDDEVLFQFGNIVSIALDEDHPHSIVVSLIGFSEYFFDRAQATNFLRNFPREYFEGSPNLLRLYDAVWIPENLPY